MEKLKIKAFDPFNNDELLDAILLIADKVNLIIDKCGFNSEPVELPKEEQEKECYCGSTWHTSFSSQTLPKFFCPKHRNESEPKEEKFITKKGHICQCGNPIICDEDRSWGLVDKNGHTVRSSGTGELKEKSLRDAEKRFEYKVENDLTDEKVTALLNDGWELKCVFPIVSMQDGDSTTLYREYYFIRQTPN